MQAEVIESAAVNADLANQQVLEAMLAMAESAPEPGTLRPQDILHKGDDEVPAPMVAASLTSAGYTIVYNRFTGDPSLCNNNMLPAQLRKTDVNPETGKTERVFVLKRPADKPRLRGETPCVLHRDRREPWMDAAGMARCRKATLMSEYEMERHARVRHKSEWAAIQRRREEQQREEERVERRASTAAMQAMLATLMAARQPDPAVAPPPDAAAAARATREARAQKGGAPMA